MGRGLGRLRQSARTLRRTPGVWALAILALALGIGANATVFAAFRGAILRPLELLPAGTVVMVSTNAQQAQQRASTSMRDYLAWRDRLRSLSEVVASQSSQRTVFDGGEPERLQVMSVSEGYFRFFGLTPALGRFMNPGGCESRGSCGHRRRNNCHFGGHRPGLDRASAPGNQHRSGGRPAGLNMRSLTVVAAHRAGARPTPAARVG